MSGSRRFRRQGVVYGPVTTRVRDNRDSALGRVVGLSIILLALLALAGGSMLFLIGGPAPSATPSSSVSPSASAIPSASIVITPVPPSIEPPQPTPTPFALAIRQGPGFVTFGTRYDPGNRIIDPATSFPVKKKLSWSAELSVPVDTGQLLLRIYSYDVQADQEQLVLEQPIEAAADQTVFTGSANPQKKLSGPAVYVVRYELGDEVLAEGWFEAVK
jgi:hypothetical protein